MDNVDDDRIVPGCRVLVYDYRLDKNDKETTARTLMKPATVVSRYGTKIFYPNMMESPWIYPDLVDVKFDHREEISHGHFTNCIEVI